MSDIVMRIPLALRLLADCRLAQIMTVIIQFMNIISCTVNMTRRRISQNHPQEP
jgi:hypothetical protein